jgi:hypothetical protein
VAAGIISDNIGLCQDEEEEEKKIGELRGQNSAQ